MKLTYSNDYFTLISKGAFPSRWVKVNDDTCKTKSISRALPFHLYADSKALDKLRPYLLQNTPYRGEIKTPKGFELRAYQKRAVKFILNQNKSYLDLDPGLGKTIIAATALNNKPGYAIYVCPPFLLLNTFREFEKWAPNAKAFILDSTKHFHRTDLDKYDLFIIPDSMIVRPAYTDFIKSNKFKWVFIDEAHRFKNLDAKRTKKVYGNYTNSIAIGEHVVSMSGTPMPNRPKELYPVLSHQVPELIDFMSYKQYALKYCGAYYDHFGFNDNGASNLETLQKRLNNIYFLSIRKTNVLKELPDKQRKFIIVSSEKTKEYKENIKALNDLDVDNINQIPIELYSGLRKAAGLSKVKATIEHVKNLIDYEPLIIFAHHLEVIERLSEGLRAYSPEVINGKTSKTRRDEIVTMFQNGQTKLIIGNISAMGVGLTLTKSKRVIFCEMDWTPGGNTQAEDRVHRIGQDSQVIIEYLIGDNSIEKKLLGSNIFKEKNINKMRGEK